MCQMTQKKNEKKVSKKSYWRITLRRLVGICITSLQLLIANLQPILRRPTYFRTNDCTLTDQYTYKQLLFTYAQINGNWHLLLLIKIAIWHSKMLRLMECYEDIHTTLKIQWNEASRELLVSSLINISEHIRWCRKKMTICVQCPQL